MALCQRVFLSWRQMDKSQPEVKSYGCKDIASYFGGGSHLKGTISRKMDGLNFGIINVYKDTSHDVGFRWHGSDVLPVCTASPDEGCGGRDICL